MKANRALRTLSTTLFLALAASLVSRDRQSDPRLKKASRAGERSGVRAGSDAVGGRIPAWWPRECTKARWFGPRKGGGRGVVA